MRNDFISFLPMLFALGLGPLLAAKADLGVSRPALRLCQGLLILFAAEYLLSAMNASYHMRTYWPSTPWRHALGPDWPSDLFWNAAHELLLTGLLFLVSFTLCCLFGGAGRHEPGPNKRD